jgi:pre-mRNA-processing factor 6
VPVQASNANDEATYSDNRFDSWLGYKGALFSKEQVDEEDRQADEAFDFCERRMEERRGKEKERKVKEELEKEKKKVKTAIEMPISEQFTDLKRELAKVTEEEWLNLPESQDSSIKSRKRERYTPTPDSQIIGHAMSATTTHAA